jgi:hypothetical protein
MTVPEWVKDLRELIDRKPSRGDIQLLIGEMLSDRNDRGAALIAGGLVEGTMKAFIKRGQFEYQPQNSKGLLIR